MVWPGVAWCGVVRRGVVLAANLGHRSHFHNQVRLESFPWNTCTAVTRQAKMNRTPSMLQMQKISDFSTKLD